MEKYPNVLQIVTDWMQKSEYDGLYNNDLECACQKDDLMPCGQFDEEECCAGYYLDASNSEFDFVIGKRKGEADDE